MFDSMRIVVAGVLNEIRQGGLYKEERVLATAQGARVSVVGWREVLNFCANNYLFSNTLAPAIAATSLAVLDILTESTELRDRLEANTRYFRTGMTERGFDLPQGDHPIVPIMLDQAALATKMASMMLDEGIYVIGFCYPVVPKGQARIRVQISAAHTSDDIDQAINAFAKVRDACRE